MEPGAPRSGDLLRARDASSPAECLGVDRERGWIPLRERRLLVPEDDRGQEVEEAVLPVGRDGAPPSP
jgi:hypothetical protein